ncbi:double-strand break repair helicase AddA [Rubrimonas cliftonensis]|uniref:DNA 3'-5' helicase n=1 Tax=Rubrimonas cliftonensis TaxID=89524 RepID=A0A1H4E3F5_9RHOB|nr:double-strand break repair helicase AddA [Rubrimonas cliftonensis]SEA79299.1 DNA helicase/exodeoxyribonuclease V, subunit A [Rubrimonas cliftonensis]
MADGATDPSRVERASAAQRRAADPHASVWTSANAGSGKTRVLTDRVARLLLAGARPERILCLTYTRAAAAEMADRLSRTLGAWALADAATLRREMRALAGPEAALDDATLARARTLFAQALETPGGLKLQTIHAFCDGVLRRFPLEAGVSPAFTVLDDAARDAAASRARDRAATEDPGAFDAAAAHVGDESLESLCAEILHGRDLWAGRPTPARLAAAFGLGEAALADDPLGALWDGFARADLRRAAVALAASSRNDGWIGAPLAEALAAAGPEESGAALARALRTDGGAGALRNFDKVPTAALVKREPWIRPLLARLADHADPLLRRAEAIAAANHAIALSRFAAAFLDAFALEKRALGALDFDDLVERAAALLTDPVAGAWARYRLDGGVDHILVDEAQDTAPRQWDVICALAEAFFEEQPPEDADGRGPGAAAGPTPRSLFVVGDEKQSIYSFQGADVALFGAKREEIDARLREGGRALVRTPLEWSFRSAPAILKAVDLTFGIAREGMTSTDDDILHAAVRPLVGRVDLWPLVPKPDDAPETPWDEPLDAPAPGNPRLLLARALAAEIRRWLDEGETLPGGDRAVRPGDVMVLVRRRDILAAELVRRLKTLGVPVAGADRLALGEALAAKDLLALARFALTPDDDLTLATVLRSPLFGMAAEALERLALGRTNAGRPGSLWAALRAAPEHAATTAALIAAMGRADYARPFEFFDAALGADAAGRRRMAARLGPEAEDAIDELLARALAYEIEAVPTLEGFVDWLGRSAVTVKREMDKGDPDGPGAVRVMTVHAAKGLEAPVVILPDCGPRAAPRGKAVARVAEPGANDRSRLPAWRLPGARAAALEEAKAAAALAERDEARRLLYVAMTRAERWLIVCGAGEEKPPKGEIPRESWRSLVAKGLESGGTALPAAAPPPLRELIGDEILRMQDAGAQAPAPLRPGPGPALSRPPWIAAPPPPAPRAPTRFRASDLGGGGAKPAPDLAPLEAPAGPVETPPARDAAAALAWGVAVHALLELLPDAPPEERGALAEAILRRAAPAADASARAAMRAEAEAVMALPELAGAFAPEATAEATLSVALPGLGVVSGRIDRLAVDAETALAVDFKTDAAPPPGAAPEPYLRQLAAYRAGLRLIYPDRVARAALVWTRIGRVDALDDAALDAALARAQSEAAG